MPGRPRETAPTHSAYPDKKSRMKHAALFLAAGNHAIAVRANDLRCPFFSK
jgi:hypothetical protein